MDNDKSRIEKLQQKLYSKKYQPEKKRSTLREKEYNINTDWKSDSIQAPQQNKPQSDPVASEFIGKIPENINPNVPVKRVVQRQPKKSSGIFGWIFGFALAFFLISAAYGGWIYYQGTQSVSANEVSINIVGPVSIGGGEELSLDVIIQNNNNVPLTSVDMIINYPAGTKLAADLVTDLKVSRISLGDIEAGSVLRESISAALFGEENATKEISVTIEYTVPGSTAIFQKTKKLDIIISASPVRLVVDGLREISSGQEMILTARLSSNSSKTLENVMIKVDYPFGFSFKTANINPNIDNNIWIFDKLDPEEEIFMQIIGEIQGQDGEDRVFRFNSGLANAEVPDEIGILWGTSVVETTINKSFIGLELVLNEQHSESIVVYSGDKVNGKIIFTNNTNDLIRDIEIEVQLDGSIVDDSTVSVSRGFYRSVDNVLVWNSEQDPIFASLEPRESYTLPFNFKTINLSDYTAQIIVINPEINIRAMATALRVSEDNVEENIDEGIASTVRILSDVIFQVGTLYDVGQFTNSGPVPPQAEVETTYTIQLVARNHSNNLENARVEFQLPSYVTWNNLTAPVSADVSYQPETRQVIWNIGDIKAGVGFNGAQAEVLEVNITLNPSISQVGLSPDLVSNLKLRAFDTFTKTNVIEEINSPNTRISNQSIGNRHQYVIE